MKTKCHKVNQMDVCKIDQMSKKGKPPSSIVRPSKSYPNLDFWFENVPSGNPGSVEKQQTKKILSTKPGLQYGTASVVVNPS
jgi:hypothetical protein